jgi:hypothetical protein
MDFLSFFFRRLSASLIRAPGFRVKAFWENSENTINIFSTKMEICFIILGFAYSDISLMTKLIRTNT